MRAVVFRFGEASVVVCGADGHHCGLFEILIGEENWKSDFTQVSVGFWKLAWESRDEFVDWCF